MDFSFFAYPAVGSQVFVCGLIVTWAVRQAFLKGLQKNGLYPINTAKSGKAIAAGDSPPRGAKDKPAGR